jgi:uncharacterized protein
VTVSRSLLRIVLTVLFFVGAGLALDAFWLEPDSLRLTRYNLQINAPVLKGLRIAVISDLHAGAPYIDGAKIDHVVAMTNAARPDLIVLTGDYVITHVLAGHHMAIETIVMHLKPLHAPLGVYAVIGNHDRWEDAAHIAATFRAAGIPVLENENMRISTPRGSLTLVGIGDHFTQASDPDRALKGVVGQALCITHSPDVFPDLPARCALTIAGHTHGGQVWLPLLGRPAVAAGNSIYGQRYAIGAIRENGKLLFVSSGIGTSGMALRFAVPPEISFLALY